MSSKQNQRFVGLILAAMGAVITIWIWYIALYYGRFYVKLAFLGPALIVLGLGATFFPKHITKSILDGSDLEPTKFGWGVIVTAVTTPTINR